MQAKLLHRTAAMCTMAMAAASLDNQLARMGAVLKVQISMTMIVW
jgi:hypothetical protein